MNEAEKQIDIQLNALADGELKPDQSEALLHRIEQDTHLREALCDIHRLKDMVRYAYAEDTLPPRRKAGSAPWRIGLAAAAIVLFTLGFMSGRLLPPNDALAPFELGQIQAQPNKVVLYLGHSDQRKFQHTLDRAEQLLEQYDGQGVEVDILTSSGGIDLLRASSPFQARIEALGNRYASLQFVVCNNTLARLARQGKPVELIERAVVQPSAVQFVVKRFKQGWSYVAI
jgi:intracellular sulfur oxidation DsrE/DsrF family protein